MKKLIGTLILGFGALATTSFDASASDEKVLSALGCKNLLSYGSMGHDDYGRALNTGSQFNIDVICPVLRDSVFNVLDMIQVNVEDRSNDWALHCKVSSVSAAGAISWTSPKQACDTPGGCGFTGNGTYTSAPATPTYIVLNPNTQYSWGSFNLWCSIPIVDDLGQSSVISYRWAED